MPPPSPIPRVVCRKLFLFNGIRGWFSPKHPVLLNLNLKTFNTKKLPSPVHQFLTLRLLIALDTLAFGGTGWDQLSTRWFNCAPNKHNYLQIAADSLIEVGWQGHAVPHDRDENVAGNTLVEPFRGLPGGRVGALFRTHSVIVRHLE